MSVPPTPENEELAKLARTANKAIFYRYMAVISITIAGVVGWFSYQGYLNLHDSQVAACEASLRPPNGVRWIVAQPLIKQEARSATLDIPAIAKKIGVPVDQLLAQQQETKQEIRGLLGVDCESLY
jgi:hypothetical protein